jgi:hypothetical protein
METSELLVTETLNTVARGVSSLRFDLSIIQICLNARLTLTNKEG